MIILCLAILLFSIICHEYAHGYIAYRCGDDTAYLLGRLTFNPVKHIDLMGSVLVPAFCYMAGLPLFGWAKPVPVNIYRLEYPKDDMAKVAFAGPAINLIIAIFCIILLKVLLLANIHSQIVSDVFSYAIAINILLALFNLMPIPPLDGSKILVKFLSPQSAAKYMAVERYGFFILIILMATGVFSAILSPIFNLILTLIDRFLGAGGF